MAEKIIAYCGITCSTCPAYIATQNNDQSLREQTAAKWSKAFGHAMQPGDINCDGCLIETGRQIGHCHVCGIRKCARARKIANCGHCPEFACRELQHILNAMPEAKENLQAVRDGLGAD